MIILATGENVAIVVRDNDMLNGTRRFYAFFNNGYYDPDNGFRPCFAGSERRRRLFDGGIEDYNKTLEDANKAFDKLVAGYDKTIEKKAAEKAPAAPATPAPGNSLGTQLETIMVQVLAQQSVEKVMETCKPMLDKFIADTYGMLPQIHEVRTPAGKKEIEGVTHEKFDTVLNLVNADIPVFLTGAAGTGKNPSA